MINRIGDKRSHISASYLEMRVLVLDDDKLITDSIARFFKQFDIFTETCTTGREAMSLIKKGSSYDAILVDLRLPDITGDDFVKSIRSMNDNIKNKVPILIFSSSVDVDDKIKSLMNGADDFLSKSDVIKSSLKADIKTSPRFGLEPDLKPNVDLRELLARVISKICRQRGIFTSLIKIGSIVVNIENKQVFVKDKELKLTKKEYNLLEILAMRKGSTVSKNTIFENLYSDIDGPTKKIIDVLICKLRKKIMEITNINCIATDWGSGYKLICEEETPDSVNKNDNNIPNNTTKHQNDEECSTNDTNITNTFDLKNEHEITNFDKNVYSYNDSYLNDCDSFCSDVEVDSDFCNTSIKKHATRNSRIEEEAQENLIKKNASNKALIT